MAQKQVEYYGTGRRKTSVARVYLRPGTGRFFVNKRPFEDYFPRASHRMDMESPLVLTEQKGSFDVHVNVNGGGQTGQALSLIHI